MKNQGKRSIALRREAKKPIQSGLLRARRFRSRVVEPRPNQLQIDLDGLAQTILFQNQLKTLQAEGIAKGWRIKIKESRQPGHSHATLTMPKDWLGGMNHKLGHIGVWVDAMKVNALMRVLLQTLLADDPRRSIHNFCRVWKGNKFPIVFFERRGNAGRRVR